MSGERPKVGDFVRYETVPVGFEATYTGGTDLSSVDTSDTDLVHFADADGNVAMRYSLWGFAHTTEDKWDDEIRAINRMQADLGPLDDKTRAIRAHIGSLVGCDNGIPVTIDELLNAIGTGMLPSPAFHNGCWLCRNGRTTQPRQAESMRVIEDVIGAYLDGQDQADLVARYPFAQGFIERAHSCLGSRDDLTEIQRLMLSRMLLPFQFFAKHTEDRDEIFHECFDEGKAGMALDAQISALAGLPQIVPNYDKAYMEHLSTIRDNHKRDIYVVCCHIADCVSELSDCHHSTFRRVERWIHGIGTLEWDILTRQPHTESTRLGRLLFGYALGLDGWLREMPMHFLLLDLGHIDLGFDPKNEILRTYAYLGHAHTPVKRWLAACLWHQCVLAPPASLFRWGRRYKELLARAASAGVSVRAWMDGLLSEPR